MQIKDLIPWARRGEAARSKAQDEHPLVELQRQINQAFEGFWGRTDQALGAGGWPLTDQGPRSDVVETEQGVEVTVELPGMEQKDVEVSLAGGTLTIRGEKKVERKEEKKGYYVSERSYGSVFRSVPLPPGCDTDKADASFRNGVLTIKIPHSPEARSKMKRIEVNST